MVSGPKQGIYYISSGVAGNVMMDMLEGNKGDGARIGAWKYADSSTGFGTFNQLWLIEYVGDNHFTIRNIRTGSYVDLERRSSDNGDTLVGRKRAGNTQLWNFHAVGNQFRIQNVATGTFIDLNGGNFSNSAKIAGWKSVTDEGSRAHQLWSLQRISYSSDDIKNILKSNPAGMVKNFTHYQMDGVYLILHPNTLHEIWRKMRLGSTRRRKEIFDCDDFSFEFKSEVAKWGSENLHADGFGILCGVMFGTRPDGSHAFNWSVANHQNFGAARLLFIEPQNGQTRDNDPFGYEPYFALF